MNLCFPCLRDEGVNGRIYGHFGSAPVFVLVDTETGETSSVPNCDELAPDAGCNPFKALVGCHVHAAVVPGIGDGFLEVLHMMGIVVFQAQSESISENIELLKQGNLEEIEMQNSAEAGACSGVGEDHQCSH